MLGLTPAAFAVAVITYRLRTGASVTSWGRTGAHNKRVGGVENSLHMVDLAVDVVYDILPELALAVQIATELGLKLIREPTHDHLQPLPTQGDPTHAGQSAPDR
jgi:peptidase M15-like protein